MEDDDTVTRGRSMIILRVTRRCGFTRHTRVNLQRVYLVFLGPQHLNGMSVS